ncbi:MAG: hypothetical protein ABIJ46_01885 [bacterium]
MKDVVSTQPLTPHNDKGLGYLLAVMAAVREAERLKADPVLAINLLGSKDKGDGRTLIDRAHLLFDGRLTVWIDAGHDWNDTLSTFVSTGRTEGWLSLKEEEIMACSCGKAEIPSRAISSTAVGSRKSVTERRGNGLTCRLCGCGLDPKTVLALSVPPGNYQDECWKAVPDYAQAEIKDHLGRAARKGIIVSRDRETGLALDIDGQKINLDPDLAIYLQPFAMKRDGMATVGLVIGNRTVRQATLTVLVSSLMIGSTELNVRALPRVTYELDTEISPSECLHLLDAGLNVKKKQRHFDRHACLRLKRGSA